MACNNYINKGTNQHFQWKVRIKDIHQNFPFAPPSRVNPHFHSQGDVQGALMEDNHTGFPLPDIHNEVLPLTLQSEIKQHQIISLIKGNLKN